MRVKRREQRCIRVNFPINFLRENFVPSRVSNRKTRSFFLFSLGKGKKNKNNEPDDDTLTSRKEDPRDRKHGSTGTGIGFIYRRSTRFDRRVRSLIYPLDEKSSFANGKFSPPVPTVSATCTTYFILLSFSQSRRVE